MIDGSMVDVTSDVRQTEPITITRGGMDEQRRPTPARCVFLLNNRSRDYSPRNPLSPYYGLLGRNTPVFMRMLLARETFGGTTVDGWGSAESRGHQGHRLRLEPGRRGWRFRRGCGVGHPAGERSRHVAVRLPARRVLSGRRGVRGVHRGGHRRHRWRDRAGVCPARGVGTNPGETYYEVRVSVSTAEALTVEVRTSAGATVAGPVTVTGVVDAVSSKAISVRAECEARSSASGRGRPAIRSLGRWHLHRGPHASGGRLGGCRSGLASGNTNAPVTFSYGIVEVYSMLFAGEVALAAGEGPVRQRPHGAGRGVGCVPTPPAGRSPLKSAYRRGVLALATPPVAYWPCEDGRDSTSVASDSPATSMWIGGTGTPTFASSSAWDCSDPLPVLASSALFGVVPTYTPTSGQSQVRMLLAIPSAGDTNSEKIWRVSTTGGTTGFWDIVYGTGSGGC